jgi:hypothetical protein
MWTEVKWLRMECIGGDLRPVTAEHFWHIDLSILGLFNDSLSTAECSEWIAVHDISGGNGRDPVKNPNHRLPGDTEENPET